MFKQKYPESNKEHTYAKKYAALARAAGKVQEKVKKQKVKKQKVKKQKAKKQKVKKQV